MVVFASLNQYKFLTPSKSMPQQSNHDFKEQYVGPLEPMRIKDISTKKLFLPYASVLNYEQDTFKHRIWQIVFDISPHPLMI